MCSIVSDEDKEDDDDEWLYEYSSPAQIKNSVMTKWLVTKYLHNTYEPIVHTLAVVHTINANYRDHDQGGTIYVELFPFMHSATSSLPFIASVVTEEDKIKK